MCWLYLNGILNCLLILIDLISLRTKTPGPGAQSALRALARSGMKIGRIGELVITALIDCLYTSFIIHDNITLNIKSGGDRTVVCSDVKCSSCNLWAMPCSLSLVQRTSLQFHQIQPEGRVDVAVAVCKLHQIFFLLIKSETKFCAQVCSSLLRSFYRFYSKTSAGFQ